MTVERLFSPALVVAAVVATAVLCVSGWSHLRPRGFAELRQQLVDADLEGDERRAALRALVGAADPSRADEQLAAALVSVALDDLDGFHRRRGCEVARLPLRASEAETFDDAFCSSASFGDDVLHRLLLAWRSEARGDRDGARAAYSQVGRSARLYRMAAAAELCAQGLARLP